MDRGYVKLWRKSIDSGMLSNPNLWTFWCWCLMKATHKPIKTTVGYQEVFLEPGQFIFGRHKAAAALKISEKTVRTCLEFLKTANNLAIKTTNKFSIITIINWDIYQGCETVDGQQNGQQNGQQGANKGPTRGQQGATNKNNNNNKNNINSDFEKFYSAYPLKKSRADALKIFDRLKKKNELPEVEDLILAIQKQQAEKDYLTQSGKFCPEWKHPSTWLNQKCWQDETVKPENEQRIDNKACPSWY